MSKELYDIALMGRQYRLASTDGPNHVRRIEKYVQRKMDEVWSVNRTLPYETVAAVVALSLAEEVFQLQEDNMRLRQERDHAIERND